MSTLEKLLVLGVLVLVGVILAISLFWSRQDPMKGGAGGDSTLARHDPTLPASPQLNEEKAPVADSSPASSAPATLNSSVLPTLGARRAYSPLARPSASPEFSLYVVQPGDNPSTVSKKLTGSTAYGSAIDRANEGKPLQPKKDILIPNVIFAEASAAGFTPGTPDPGAANPSTASAPPKPGTAARKPAAATPSSTESSAGTTEYVVRRNDSLRAIARKLLKDERRWKEIVELNHLSGDMIREGQKLKLPQASERGR